MAAERQQRAAWLKRQRQLVAEWSKRPIGTPVTILRDNGTEVKTMTRSEPQLLGDVAVIWVHGIAGAYALERVTFREEP